MSGTGYASIGQLFELSKDQSLEGFKYALLPLISKLYVYLDEDVIDPKAYSRLDAFFKSLENQKQGLNIESAVKFIGGVLKCHGVDDISFQLQVEKAVWSILKCNPDFYKVHRKYKTNNETEKDKCFHLFCIFNRFCESRNNKMMLAGHYRSFLVSQFSGDNEGYPATNAEKSSLNFIDCLTKVCEGPSNPQVEDAIKHAYDEYARDVVLESTLSLRTRIFPAKQGKSPILGKLAVEK